MEVRILAARRFQRVWSIVRPPFPGMSPTIFMNVSIRRLLAACLLASGLLLAACGSSSDTNAPGAATSLRADTSVPVVATSTSTVVSAPSSTPDATPTPSPSPTSTAVPTSTPVTVPAASATPEADDDEESLDRYDDLSTFQAALDDLLRDVDGTVAVSLALPDGTVLWEQNAHEPMEAASLYKLAIMVEIYRQQAEGSLSFGDAVQLTGAYLNEGEDSYTLDDVGSYFDIETLMTSMIVHSSNVAAYALLDLVGSSNVNATMVDLGLEGIEIRWSPQDVIPPAPPPEEDEDSVPEDIEPQDDPVEEPAEEPPAEELPDEPADEPQQTEEPAGAADPVARWLAAGTGVTATVRGEAAFNVTQSSDLAQLLVLMLNGSVVSESASQAMLELLGRQEIYGGLPALLPEGTVAHKTGYLEDGIVNDAGVVYTPHGPMVAVVLTEDVGEYAAYDIASQIGLLLYQLGSDQAATGSSVPVVSPRASAMVERKSLASISRSSAPNTVPPNRCRRVAEPAPRDRQRTAG